MATTNGPDIIIGIDPGTGISSPTGFSAIDVHTKEIFYAGNITTNRKELAHRIKHISDIFENTLLDIVKANPNATITCYVEQFVMRGKGGETLQRLVGSLLGRIPYDIGVEYIQNSTVKAVIAGHGQADKTSVARGLEGYFLTNPKSYGLIKELVENGEFDIIDSLAIGITGWRTKPKVVKRSKTPP